MRIAIGPEPGLPPERRLIVMACRRADQRYRRIAHYVLMSFLAGAIAGACAAAALCTR